MVLKRAQDFDVREVVVQPSGMFRLLAVAMPLELGSSRCASASAWATKTALAVGSCQSFCATCSVSILRNMANSSPITKDTHCARILYQLLVCDMTSLNQFSMFFRYSV